MSNLENSPKKIKFFGYGANSPQKIRSAECLGEIRLQAGDGHKEDYTETILTTYV